MPVWRCYYHVNWATKGRAAWITRRHEPVIFGAIRAKSAEVGCRVFAINGTEDHIHVAVSIPPSMQVSKWIGTVKGVASHSVNTAFPDTEERFRWQEGYGLFTFGERSLPGIVDYIRLQKQHHADGTTKEYLERFDVGAPEE